MIALCPPINGIKSEFMPDRHENGRPTLSRFDMKSDRYCVEPVCVWGLFVPRDQFDMRACREWSTNAALEVVSHAMCSRTTLQGARANARPTSLHTTVVYVSCALNNLWVWIIQRDCGNAQRSRKGPTVSFLWLLLVGRWALSQQEQDHASSTAVWAQQ